LQYYVGTRFYSSWTVATSTYYDYYSISYYLSYYYPIGSYIQCWYDKTEPTSVSVSKLNELGFLISAWICIGIAIAIILGIAVYFVRNQISRRETMMYDLEPVGFNYS